MSAKQVSLKLKLNSKRKQNLQDRINRGTDSEIRGKFCQ